MKDELREKEIEGHFFFFFGRSCHMKSMGKERKRVGQDLLWLVKDDDDDGKHKAKFLRIPKFKVKQRMRGRDCCVLLFLFFSNSSCFTDECNVCV